MLGADDIIRGAADLADRTVPTSSDAVFMTRDEVILESAVVGSTAVALDTPRPSPPASTP